MGTDRTPGAAAQVRLAVRRALGALPAEVRAAPLLVACSGGADSLALSVAAAAERPGAVHAAIVDHGLQDGSAQRSAELAELLVTVGVPAAVYPVRVDGRGGLEAAARRARYAALAAARPHPDSAVLLGHTLDDQAETVLLGLGRGSGARSISGMRAWTPPWARPLLGLRRVVTREACREHGLPVWDDPHNDDPRFTRVRLRREVLPLLEDVLAGGVAEALARTAAQLADDSAALDGYAALVRAAAETRGGVSAEPVHGTPGDTADHPAGGVAQHAPTVAQVVRNPAVATALAVDVLREAPAAVRRRVLRAWLLDTGVTELTDAHLRSADDLVGRWRGQGGVALPGGLDLARRDGTLVLRRTQPPQGG